MKSKYESVPSFIKDTRIEPGFTFGGRIDSFKDEQDIPGPG